MHQKAAKSAGLERLPRSRADGLQVRTKCCGERGNQAGTRSNVGHHHRLQACERLAPKATGCHITAAPAARGPCRKRQTTRLNCFKSTGDSIEFAAAIRRGLAERPNSFI